jgi:hypothetical protein
VCGHRAQLDPGFVLHESDMLAIRGQVLAELCIHAAPLLSADVCPICTPWHDIAAQSELRSSKPRDLSSSISARRIEGDARWAKHPN